MASILAVMSLSILFRSIYFIAARSFYAQQDTKTPLYISFFTIGMNIVLAVWFTLGLDMGVQGLAWAAVITAIVEVAILFSLMSRRIDGLFDAPFVSAVTRMMSAAGFTALISYVMVSLFPLQADDESFFATFPKFVLIAGVSLLSYVLISYLFKLSEAQPVIRRAWKILFGRIPVKSKK